MLKLNPSGGGIRTGVVFGPLDLKSATKLPAPQAPWLMFIHILHLISSLLIAPGVVRLKPLTPQIYYSLVDRDVSVDN